MKKSYIVGTQEKHRVDFQIDWLLGMVHFSSDGRILVRRPFFLKFEKAFEIGNEEKHVVKIYFSPFDYYRNFFQILIDGQPPRPYMKLPTGPRRRETPADDAAAVFLFLAAANFLLALIGPKVMPAIQSLQDRLLLFAGAMIYLLFMVQTLQERRLALAAGISIFAADTVYAFFQQFSVGGILLRAVIFYALILGLKYLTEKKRLETTVTAGADSTAGSR